jgi:hypothetical protein
VGLHLLTYWVVATPLPGHVTSDMTPAMAACRPASTVHSLVGSVVARLRPSLRWLLNLNGCGSLGWGELSRFLL